MARIAIVGSGISGLGAASLLHPHHDITVYEKAGRIGGHARTLTVDYDGHAIAVDTGFIVFNRVNYPNLTGLFAHLGVPVHESDMSFAATIGDGWLEWGSRDLGAVFGQRRNLFRPKFAGMMRDIMRFNAQALATVTAQPGLTLKEFFAHLGLGDWFQRFYLLPMAGAIWSCPLSEMEAFPALTLVRFFANHHLLSVKGQHQWYTVSGGSQQYVSRLAAPFSHKIRQGAGAEGIWRHDGIVSIRDAAGETADYDEVVLACPADEARRLLKDMDAKEQAALSPFRYQKNIAVLHRDTRVMPRRRPCWASWVYRSDGETGSPNISVSYWMNRLQGIDPSRPLFVTLNPNSEIADDLTFDTHAFQHPVLDHAAVQAQSLVASLQGQRQSWFCGAHLGYGFHEDGLASAVRVARLLGCPVPWDSVAAPIETVEAGRPQQPALAAAAAVV